MTEFPFLTFALLIRSLYLSGLEGLGFRATFRNQRMEDDHAICSSALARRFKWSMELSNYVQLGLQPDLPLVLSLQGHVGEIVISRVICAVGSS